MVYCWWFPGGCNECQAGQSQRLGSCECVYVLTVVQAQSADLADIQDQDFRFVKDMADSLGDEVGHLIGTDRVPHQQWQHDGAHISSMIPEVLI